MSIPPKPGFIPYCVANTATDTSFRLEVSGYLGTTTGFEPPYKVRLYRDGAVFKENSPGTASTTVFLWSEKSGESHSFQLIAVDGNSHLSPASDSITIKSIPPIPTNLVLTTASNTVSATWAGMAQSYMATCSNQTKAGITRTSHTFTGLQPGTKYEVRVYPEVANMFMVNGVPFLANAWTVGKAAVAKSITTEATVLPPQQIVNAGPVISWNIPADNTFFNTRSVSVLAQVTDESPGVKNVLFKNKTNNNTESGTYSTSGFSASLPLSPGVNQLECAAYDLAGIETKKTKNITCDIDPPIVTGVSWKAMQIDGVVRDVTFTSNLTAYSSSAELKISAGDSSSGIASGKVLQNGTEIESFVINPVQNAITKTFILNNIGIANGMNYTSGHIFIVQIYDRAGNVGQLNLAVSRGAGPAAPIALAITSPENGSTTNSSNVSVGGTCSNITFVDVKSYDSSGNTLYATGTATVTGSTWSGVVGTREGASLIKVIGSGGGQSTHAQRTIYLDTVAPAVEIVSLHGTNAASNWTEIRVEQTTAVYGPRITVNARASDSNSKIAIEQIYVRDNLVKTNSISPRLAVHEFSFDVDLFPGTNTLSIKATDGAGNIGTANFGGNGFVTVNYIYKNTGPTIDVTYPTEGQYLYSKDLTGITGTWADSDDVALVKVSAYNSVGEFITEQVLENEAIPGYTGITHATTTNGTWGASLSSLPDGKTELRVEATDKLSAKTTMSRWCWINSGSPSVVITVPENNSTLTVAQTTLSSYATEDISWLKKYSASVSQNGVRYLSIAQKDLVAIYSGQLKTNITNQVSDVITLRAGLSNILVEYWNEAGNRGIATSEVTCNLVASNAPLVEVVPADVWYSYPFYTEELAFNVDAIKKASTDSNIVSIDIDFYPYKKPGEVTAETPFYRIKEIRNVNLSTWQYDVVIEPEMPVISKQTPYSGNTLAAQHLGNGYHAIKITIKNAADLVTTIWRMYQIDTSNIVANIKPQNASENVALKQDIEITFSAAVVRDSAEAGIQLSGDGMNGVTGSWAWSNDTTVTYVHTPFKSGKSVLVRILGNTIQSLTNTNKFVYATSSNFNIIDFTGPVVERAVLKTSDLYAANPGALVAASEDAMNPVNGIRPDTSITIYFSKAMNWSTLIANKTIFITDSVLRYCDYGGTYKIRQVEIDDFAQKTVAKFEIDPSTPLNWNDRYVVVLNNKIKDNAKNALSAYIGDFRVISIAGSGGGDDGDEDGAEPENDALLSYRMSFSNGLNGFSVPLDNRQGKTTIQKIRNYFASAINATAAKVIFWYDNTAKKWIGSFPGVNNVSIDSKQFNWQDGFFVQMSLDSPVDVYYRGYIIDNGTTILNIKSGLNLIGVPLNTSHTTIKQVAEYLAQKMGKDVLVTYMARTKGNATEKGLVGYTYSGPSTRSGFGFTDQRLGGSAIAIVSTIDTNITISGSAWRD